MGYAGGDGARITPHSYSLSMKTTPIHIFYMGKLYQFLNYTAHGDPFILD